MKMKLLPVCVNLGVFWPCAAFAHASEQGLVLLLPTGAYISAGVATVALTVVALFALPSHTIKTLFSSRPIASWNFSTLATTTSLLSLCLMGLTLHIGLFGSRDPLSNIMPLSFWTVGWIALISLSGFFGDIWRWVNPWTGLYRLLGSPAPFWRMPDLIGLWPATFVFIGFAAFLLADIAPDDPSRLARILALYWIAVFFGLIAFGPRWLHSVELGHAIFTTYARLAPLRLRQPAGLGAPGWQLLARPVQPAAGVFCLTLLAVGSFDGLNETFWWLAQIGVNPLEFPGRSAVVSATLTGLIGGIVFLTAMFSLTVWIGLQLGKSHIPFRTAFGTLALSLLPIALVYHIAHYLTSFMVNIQYTFAALSDPFATGADWLGLQPFRVTTGFFNHIDSVRIIWSLQAGLVVLGHVWSVLLSHRLALRLFNDDPKASLATLPLSIFMIFYTFLGLWLLAAPKGA